MGDSTETSAVTLQLCLSPPNGSLMTDWLTDEFGLLMTELWLYLWNLSETDFRNKRLAVTLNLDMSVKCPAHVCV